MTLSLFSRPNADPWAEFFIPSDPDGLRYYQRDAYDADIEAFKTKDRIMNVMATGLGKTELFVAIAKHWGGAVLVLAHRDELVGQAARRLERNCQEYVEIEMAEMTSSPRTRLVVGSVQSMTPKRLERLGKNRFSLVIFDEFHHALAPTYRRAWEWFDCKKLGVTATPDRADKKSLGQLLDDNGVVYNMDILRGIQQGWLVPIKGTTVTITAINLDAVKIDHKSRDLAEGELDRAYDQHTDAIVQKVLELEPGRKGICFFPGVASAEHACAAFNARRPDSATFVCGATPKEERRNIIRAFQEGRFQYLCNCQIATEGFDAPSADLIVLARPTTSRSLFAQMVGRGTRPLPDSISYLDGRDQSLDRQRGIALSKKPDLMLIDFAGTCHKHNLIGLEDLLGGEYSEVEVKKAKSLRQKKSDGGGQVVEMQNDVSGTLARVRADIQAAVNRGLKIKVTATVEKYDPFANVGLSRDLEAKHAARYGTRPASDGQLQALKWIGLKPEELRGLSHYGASKLLDEIATRRKKNLASYKQARLLRQFGVNDPTIPFERASAALTYIERKGWGRKNPIDQAVLNEILYHKRQSGED